MIDINGWELVIIVVLVLLVFGPERLPEFLFRAGQLIRQFRQMTEEATSEITREFRAAADLAESELKAPLSATLAEAKAPFTELSQTLTAATTLPALTSGPPGGDASATAASAGVSGEQAALAPEPSLLPTDLPSIAPYPPLFDGPVDSAPETTAERAEEPTAAEDPDAA
jgi:sec-independent protein translocase protein TatB